MVGSDRADGEALKMGKQQRHHLKYVEPIGRKFIEGEIPPSNMFWIRDM